MKPPAPKYFVIKSILQGRFDRDFAPGDKLPSEYALCAEFSVSRITIQRALNMLEKEGLIAREQGRGTFYRGAGARRTETAPSKLLESMIRQQPRSYARLLSSSLVPAGPRIAERLALAAGSPVVVVGRGRAVDKEPISFLRRS